MNRVELLQELEELIEKARLNSTELEYIKFIANLNSVSEMLYDNLD